MNSSPTRTMEPLFETEEKVRKDWRWALGLFYFGHVIVLAVSCFYVFYLGDSESANNILKQSIVKLIVMAISLAILNYFAYMKSGNKWLGFYLVVSAIRIAVETIKDGVEVYSIPDLTIIQIGYYLIFHAILLGVFVYFWIHCIRLHDLNTVIKKRKAIKKNDEAQLQVAS